MLKYRIQRQIFVILLENNFCARLEGLRQGGRRNLLSKVIISGGGGKGEWRITRKDIKGIDKKR